MRAAAFWFRQSAIRGNARAQRRLALCYFHGMGIRQDEKKGIEWLERAAKNGDAEARKLLTP
jgi:TPR repeat protein